MEPWELGVLEALESMDRKVLSATELTESLLRRIDNVEEELHAWVTIDAEGARERAQSVQREGNQTLALRGVPVGIKDVIDVAGLPTTAASRVLTDNVPEEDATSVRLLRQEGAIILGKLQTAEFACGDPGPTRNPWNGAHTPGGSSNGSAVAVAAGMVPAAIGTQTGGSILRPASYNGVVGLKPTYGLISNDGVIPVAWSLDHVGVLARSVGDAAAVLPVLTGSRLERTCSLMADRHHKEEKLQSGAGPVIGVVNIGFIDQCVPEMSAETWRIVARLEAAGASLREIRLPESYRRLAATAQDILSAELYAYHCDRYSQDRELYGRGAAAAIEKGREVTAVAYIHSLRERREIVCDLERTLEGVDVLLTPCTPAAAPKDVTTTGTGVFQVPWSYGGLPAIALPSGLDSRGLPVGVQLVGRRWADESLVAVASWCEAVLEFRMHPGCWSEREPRCTDKLGGSSLEIADDCRNAGTL